MASVRKKRKYSRSGAETTERRYNSFMTGLAALFLSVTPLVIRYVRLDFISPDITNTTSADTDTIFDVFTHVKTQLIYALVAILAAVFCAKLLTVAGGSASPAPKAAPKTAPTTPSATATAPITAPGQPVVRPVSQAQGFRLTRYDAALAVLCLALLLSCLTSQYPSIALNGFAYMLDGTASHICYCALFFFGFHVFTRSGLKKLLFLPLYAAGIANALISFLNFIGVRLIDTQVIRTVLGIPHDTQAASGQSLTSTFGNINYLSGFGGVLFSIFLAKLMFSKPAFRDGSVDRRALISNVCALLAVAVSFSIIVTSLSSSGFLTFAVMTPAIFIIAAASGLTKRKLALFAASLAVCAAVFAPLAAANKAVFEETFGMFRSLSLSADADGANGASARGGANAIGDTGSRSGAAAAPPLELPPVSQLKSQLAPQQAIRLSVEAASQRSPLSPPLPEEFPSEGIAPGSGRLYIWGETLKLAARRPILGYGMDTLSYAFPQNDLNKIAGLGSYSVFVTKPHNAYIGYAYGAGAPAILAFLVLCAFGAIEFIRYFLFARAARLPHDPLIVCAMVGWAAYMTQAFVNDDLIATAQLWWTLFGLGAGSIRLALNGSRSARQNPR